MSELSCGILTLIIAIIAFFLGVAFGMKAAEEEEHR